MKDLQIISKLLPGKNRSQLKTNPAPLVVLLILLCVFRKTVCYIHTTTSCMLFYFPIFL